jgi:hypothetical protein
VNGGGRISRERKYRIDVNGGGSAGLANLTRACVSAYTLAAIISNGVGAKVFSRAGARKLGRRGKRGGGGQGGSDDGREKPFSCKECVLGTLSDG